MLSAQSSVQYLLDYIPLPRIPPADQGKDRCGVMVAWIEYSGDSECKDLVAFFDKVIKILLRCSLVVAFLHTVKVH